MIQLPDDFTDRINESLEYYMNEPYEIYLTRDKLCKCITECTDKGSNSWCYVDKECPNNTSGYRGYYKLCNHEKFYDNIKEADEEIYQQKLINTKREKNAREEKELGKLMRASRLRQKDRKKNRELEKAFYDLIVNYNKIGNFTDIKLISKSLYAKIFSARYSIEGSIYDVIIKYRHNIQKYRNELKYHMKALQLGVAPNIYLYGEYNINDMYENIDYFHSKYSIIVMDYLDPVEWITLSNLRKDNTIRSTIYSLKQFRVNEEVYEIYLRKICRLIEILHENNIAHRDLHSNNIMVNIKHQYSGNNVMIIDYDDAKTIKENENPWVVERSGIGGGDGDYGTLCKSLYEKKISKIHRRNKYFIKYF